MRRLLLIISLLFYTTACAPYMSLQSPALGDGPMPGSRQNQESFNGLRVTTHDRDELLFAADGWTLTTSGIEGRAIVQTLDGQTFSKDTTLSYWDAASAAPASRDNTMSQFMLTILGVILVLGLAAIILYAAFLATAR